ncbi:MMPL family transporter [Nocardia harenae]|uniref:MMPL family transporter n=1 Tax=Nocardia harenae TaxID=358707 RepID=UPI000B001244|nr:MMPL family transporter [Nocardia harenae]
MNIYQRLAEVALRAPRVVAITALLFLVIAGVVGAPAALNLPAGGYEDPSAESTRAQQILAEQFGRSGLLLVLEISGPAGVDDPAVKRRAEAVSATVAASEYAGEVLSSWSVPPVIATGLVTADRSTGLVAAEIAGSDSEAPKRARDIADRVVGENDGVTVRAGGPAIVLDDTAEQSRLDLVKVEAIAIPITFVALMWIFGSVVAALLPLVVAVVAIAGTTAVLRLLSLGTDVSAFALNLATALCLALAIDYTLLIVNRYREHLAAGADTRTAIVRTMTTTGRAVTYSALTVVVVAAVMAVFPMYLLQSLAYAGMAGAAVSLLGTLVLAPALLVLAGPNIDRGDIRKPVRRRLGLPAEPSTAPEDSIFYKVAVFAMRRAVPVALAVTVFCGVLLLPFLGVQLAYPDDRVLPRSIESRQVGDSLREDYRQNFTGSVRIVLTELSAPDRQLDEYALALSKVPGVTSVSGPSGTYVGGLTALGTPVGGAERQGETAFLTVGSTIDPYSPAGEELVAALRAVPAPATALFDGLAQRSIDFAAGVVDTLPLVLALIALATFVLMFLLTGSVILPVKALLMNVLSLTAAFGAVVWVFQDGHLGGLGVTTTGYLNAAFLPLIFCLAYGLSMDYEIFVISRIREEWLKSGRTAEDNERAVALGLAKTGRIVTAAAVLMAIVFAALCASQISMLRLLGACMALSVLIDAFLVRMLLVPAFMKLMGNANWWAPAPIAGWLERRMIHESDDEVRAPAVPAQG